MKKAIFVLTILAFAAVTFADHYTWNNLAGGIFGNPNNWMPTGVPGANDRALFLFDVYGIELAQSHTLSGITVDAAIWMDLKQYILTLASPLFEDPAVLIADTQNARLFIENGTINSGDVIIGWNGGTQGELTIGYGAVWTAKLGQQWYGTYLGFDGNGKLEIYDDYITGHLIAAQNGSTSTTMNIYSNGQLYVDGLCLLGENGSCQASFGLNTNVDVGVLHLADQPNSRASVAVRGAVDAMTMVSCRAENETSLMVGRMGTAELTVSGEGTNTVLLLSLGTTTIGQTVGGQGTLTVLEGGYVECLRSIFVGGSQDAAGGIGRLRLIDDPYGNDELQPILRTAIFENEKVVVWPAGQIEMENGRLIAIYGDGEGQPNNVELRGGALRGNGQIEGNLVNQGGLVLPWGERFFKTLEITHNYQQDANATLRILIGGYPWEEKNSKLVISGNAALNGFLDVDLAFEYTPGYNDEYVIIQANAISGQFINAPTKVVCEGGTFDIVYSANAVTLTHFTATPKCPTYPLMDYNRDCKVSLPDLVELARRWLQCNLQPSSACAL